MIKPSGVKFTNNGDMEVAFVIPARFRKLLEELGYAMRTPLLVTVEAWRNSSIPSHES